jgi:hypothetical protein
MSMSDSTSRFRVGDPVRLKDSEIDLLGDVWQFRTGRYVVVRWEDACRSTHSENALEFDPTRSKAEWCRPIANEDR